MRTFALATCSLLIALGVVELALRTTHAFNARLAWTEPDPMIGFRMTPARAYWFFNENDHAIEGRVNGLGWRDRERTRTKPVGTRRVAVLGDSYVEALQVELDSTFVSVAERELNRRAGARYEFMNFGRSGMNGVDELIVLKRDVLPCDPDVVVLLFTPSNDVADVNRATATTTLRPFCVVDARDSLALDTSFRNTRGYKFREVLNPFKQHSVLVSLVAERYGAWQLARSAGTAGMRDGAGATTLTREQRLLTAHADSASIADYALAKRIVVEMARVCTSRGVAFVLMSVPLVYEGDALATLRGIDPTLDPNRFDNDFAALADTAGFKVVPLAEAFSSRSLATGARLHWAHWNYEGHRLAGAELAAGLMAGEEPAPRRANQ